ncbi:MAG: rhomboid family intramembrane serine protease [Anaerolineae bacterium]
MIPLRDINPTRAFPLVTVFLIVANALVFLYELALPSQEALNRFVSAMGVVPYEIIHNVDIPPPSLHPVYLTLLTAMFLHGGFVHIIGNMLYLWIFGNNVEDTMGSLRFLFFYLICGLGASGAQIGVVALQANQANSLVPNIGASGAIAGVLGAYLLLFPRAQVDTLLILGYMIRVIRLPAILVLSFWIVIQFFSGIASLGMPQAGGVAWFAHIGGFVAGVLLINVFRKKRYW